MPVRPPRAGEAHIAAPSLPHSVVERFYPEPAGSQYGSGTGGSSGRVGILQPPYEPEPFSLAWWLWTKLGWNPWWPLGPHDWPPLPPIIPGPNADTSEHTKRKVVQNKDFSEALDQLAKELGAGSSRPGVTDLAACREKVSDWLNGGEFGGWIAGHQANAEDQHAADLHPATASEARRRLAARIDALVTKLKEIAKRIEG